MFTGNTPCALKDALFLSASRTVHLLENGAPIVRVQSFPYHYRQMYVVHRLELDGDIPVLVNDTICSEDQFYAWLVEQGFAVTVELAKLLTECPIWEPEIIIEPKPVSRKRAVSRCRLAALPA